MDIKMKKTDAKNMEKTDKYAEHAKTGRCTEKEADYLMIAAAVAMVLLSLSMISGNSCFAAGSTGSCITGRQVLYQIKYAPITVKETADSTDDSYRLAPYALVSRYDAKKALLFSRRVHAQLEKYGLNCEETDRLLSESENSFLAGDYKPIIENREKIESAKNRIFSLNDSFVLIKNKLALYSNLLDNSKIFEYSEYSKAKAAFKKGNFNETERLVKSMKADLGIG